MDGGAAAPALVQYGALGILALMALLAVRVLFAQVKADKDRETARADRNEEALRELNKAVQERVIPAGYELVTATKSIIELMAQIQADRRRGP